MNFSELYKCWRFAENVSHPHKVELHKSIHDDICEMLPSPSRGEEKYNEIRRFHNYMEDILRDNKKTSTMIKELVEEIDRLKEA